MITVVLENIRSVYNVGSIFRTMEGFGFSKVVLIGITPTPLDKYGNKRSDFHKTALGAEDRIQWEHFETIDEYAQANTDTKIISIETEGGSEDVELLPDFLVGHNDVSIVFGAEVDGISDEARAMSEKVFHIPMHGIKESFNVSVAAGIVLYVTKNSL